MLEGIFEINSYEIDDLLKYIGTTSNELEEENEKAKQTFEPNKKSEIFGKGSKTINDQMDEIFNQIDHLEFAMKKGTSLIFETEMKILDEARDLQIPVGFETNNMVKNNAASGIKLDKNDGRSVNEGNSSKEITFEMNSEIEKENLKDITSTNTIEQRLAEEQINLGKINLSNIENGITEEKAFNENGYTNNKQILETMDNNTTKEINNEVSINEISKHNLTGINRSLETPESTEIKFSERMNEIKKENIDDIDKNSTGTEQVKLPEENIK